MPTKSKGLLHIRDFPIYKRATHWNNNEKRHETRTQQIISEKIVQYEDFHLVISSLSETHVKLSGQCSCVSSPKWKTCNQNWKCYRKKDETNQRWWWNQRTECWIQTHTHTHSGRVKTAKRQGQVNLFNHFKKWLLFNVISLSRNRCVVFFLF